jgi:hypothetical protein
MKKKRRQPLFSVPNAGRPARSMSRELKRWLPGSALEPASPWAQWARGFVARYAGIVERAAPLGFVLLRRRSLIQTVRDRWFVRSQSFFPKIQLSVQTVLRAGGPTVFRQVTEPADRHAQAVQRLLLVERQKMDDKAEEAGHPSRQSSATAELKRSISITSPAPLERIFQNSKKPGGLSQKRDFGNAIRLMETVERIVQRSERIESRYGDSPISTTNVLDPAFPAVRIGPSYPTGVRRHGVESDQSGSHNSLSANDKGSPHSKWPDLARAPESMNIEHITDQVMRRLDQRVVAARERIGRTF